MVEPPTKIIPLISFAVMFCSIKTSWQKSIVLLMTLLKQLIKSCFVKVKLYCFDFKVN